jgi:RimJ/RimL family protein N-acetyltransferase
VKISVFQVETPRLLIRTYTEQDALSLYNLVASEKNILHDYFPMTVESNTSVEASRKFIIARLEETRMGKSVFVGIFEKTSNTLIGQIAIKDINWRVPKCELGYFIASQKQGNGLASEALNAVAGFCFEKAGMVKLLLRIENSNAVSKRVAEKCSFTYSGTLRNDFRSSEGRLMDCEVWERLR